MVIEEEKKAESVKLSQDTKIKIKEVQKRRLDDRQRKNTIDAIVNEAMDLLIKKTARK